MDQAANLRPVTKEAQVRARVSPCGICGGQSGTGTGFSRVLRFFSVNIIPPWLSTPMCIAWGVKRIVSPYKLYQVLVLSLDGVCNF
jgi:hypothetical protein